MEGNQLRRQILRLMASANRDFGIVEEADRILIGLSGGKDSLALVDMLAHRQKVRVPHIEVQAVHVRMHNVSYSSDTDYLRQFCEQRGVPLHVRTTGFEWREGSKKPACFLCSWERRKVMFNLAQELGCNKIALGHHQDDVIRTALMNLTFQGQFASMPAILHLERMPLALIRPLCAVPESLIVEWAEQEHYMPQTHRCPYEHETNRTHIGSVIEAMEALNPDMRSSLWNALRNKMAQ